MDNVKLAAEHFFQGLHALQRDDLATAEMKLLEALRLVPDRPSTLTNLSIVCSRQGRLAEALEYAKSAVRADGRPPLGWLQQGTVLLQLGKYDESLAATDAALERDVTIAEAHYNRGVALRRTNRFEEATASFGAAIKLKPDYVEPLIELAQIEAAAGQFKQAQKTYQKALLLDPNSVQAVCGLTEVKKFEDGDPLISVIETRLANRALASGDRAELLHAYGKVCNDLGHYDDAMSSYAEGKKLLKSNFDMKRHGAAYAAMRKLFTREFFLERSNFGLPDERPVFVTGMPRSGTTLTEQILSSHSRVEGLGELNDLPALAKMVGGGLTNPDEFVDVVSMLSRADVSAMAQRYLDGLKLSQTDSLRVIDKRPHNYEFLGLIALMFPRAHIIHCRRDALDNCVSMYMRRFNESHGYILDLSILAQYYREYEGLMRHWAKVLPLTIHECLYEDVVRDLEGSARSMLATLGLEWDPKCLDFHQTDRNVSTQSKWQVRQPLYDKSIGRWKRYEKHLAPLKEALARS